MKLGSGWVSPLYYKFLGTFAQRFSVDSQTPSVMEASSVAPENQICAVLGLRKPVVSPWLQPSFYPLAPQIFILVCCLASKKKSPLATRQEIPHH